MEHDIRYTKVQTYDWGLVGWKTDPADVESQRLSVAEVVFFPGKVQKKHANYREEQVMYVLSGKGLYTVNGHTRRIAPGDSIPLPPYAEHTVQNDTETELRFLLVSSPSRLQPLLWDSSQTSQTMASGDNRFDSIDLCVSEKATQGTVLSCQPAGGQSFCPAASVEPVDEFVAAKNEKASATNKAEEAPVKELHAGLIAEQPPTAQGFFDDAAKQTIRATMERMSSALGLSLSMVDTEGKRIVRTHNHPRFCSALGDHTAGMHCRTHLQKVFQALPEAALDKPGKPLVINCCHSIASTLFPIVIDGRIQAYMKCGEIFLSGDEKEALLGNIGALAEAYGMSRTFLHDAARDIPVQPKSRIYAAAEASFAMTSAVTSMALAAQRQKELDISRLSLAQEQLATTRLEKALHEADLKLLQSQVTPHFFFNTLNTIALTAYGEGAKKATELTWSLSDLLRATLRKTEELISLQEEINLLNCYIHIQNTRFGDRIAFRIEVDPDCMTVPVPSLLFQPLVENSIVHGFGSITRSGSITLRIVRDGACIRAVLTDDGAGFTPRQTDEGPKRIGLRSVQNRLAHYYGEEGHMMIESAPGAGTRITMRIPDTGEASETLWENTLQQAKVHE